MKEIRNRSFELGLDLVVVVRSLMDLINPISGKDGNLKWSDVPSHPRMVLNYLAK